MRVGTPGYQQTLKSFSGPHWRRGSRLNSTISKASWSTSPRGGAGPVPGTHPKPGWSRRLVATVRCRATDKRHHHRRW